MNMPADFANTQTKTNDTPKYATMTGGGHKCRINTVEEHFTQAGSNYLLVTFDICGDGELDGYYKKLYDRNVEKFGDAKYRGEYRQFVLDRDGKCSPYFKGFVEAVERSNPGYKFNGDERTMAGKLIGFVFRNEPYVNKKGETVSNYVPAWACEYNKAPDQKEPNPKAVRQQQNTFAAPTPAADDDVPF